MAKVADKVMEKTQEAVHRGEESAMEQLHKIEEAANNLYHRTQELLIDIKQLGARDKDRESILKEIEKNKRKEEQLKEKFMMTEANLQAANEEKEYKLQVKHSAERAKAKL